MRFKLSSSVTLSSSVPRPSPCTATPLIYWSQSLCTAWNGVTYHEGFCHLGILSLCSLSTQSALFHQAGRRTLQKHPGISAALHAKEEKRAHCPFFREPPSSRTKPMESSTQEWQSAEKHSFDAVVLFRWPQLIITNNDTTIRKEKKQLTLASMLTLLCSGFLLQHTKFLDWVSWWYVA